MVTGAELLGRLRTAREHYATAGALLEASRAAAAERHRGGWINLSNEKARARSKSRVDAMPGVLHTHIMRSGSLFLIEVMHLGMVDGRPGVVSDLIHQRKGQGPREFRALGTVASNHAHERLIQRLADDDGETIAEVHCRVRNLIARRHSKTGTVWLDQPTTVAVGTLSGALAVVALDAREDRRLAEIITVVDHGLLRPEQEALVAKFQRHEATLEDALAGARERT